MKPENKTGDFRNSSITNYSEECYGTITITREFYFSISLPAFNIASYTGHIEQVKEQKVHKYITNLAG